MFALHRSHPTAQHRLRAWILCGIAATSLASIAGLARLSPATAGADTSAGTAAIQTLSPIIGIGATDPIGDLRDPRGIAVAPNGTVLVVDRGNARIVRLSRRGAVLDSWGGMGAAAGRFHTPMGIDVAADGTVFVADTGNHRIQHFDAAGRLLDIIDVPGRQGHGPTDVAIGLDGSVYVADDDTDDLVRCFSADGHALQSWRRRGELILPSPAPPIAFSDLDVYGQSTWGTDVGPQSSRVAAPHLSWRDIGFFLAVGPQGTIYTANFEIRSFTPEGRFLAEWSGEGTAPGQIRGPGARGIDVGADGTVFVVEGLDDDGRLQAFDPDGSLRFARQFDAPGPRDLAVGNDGSLYVARSSGAADKGHVLRLSPEGHALERYGQRLDRTEAEQAPMRIALRRDNQIVVSDPANDRLLRYSRNGAFLGAWGGPGTSPDRFDEPSGIAVDESDAMFVAEAGNHRIQVLDAEGRYRHQWGTFGSGDGQFDRPLDLVFASIISPWLWVADSGNHRIQVFDANGYGGDHGWFDEHGLSHPSGLASTRDTIAVADSGNARVLHLDLLGIDEPPRVIAPGSPSSRPEDVALVDGAYWVADSGDGTVLRFDSAARLTGEFDADGGFREPSGIAGDLDGSVWVVDEGQPALIHLSSTGAVIDGWPLPGSGDGIFGRYDTPDVTASSDGGLVVLDGRGRRIHRFDRDGRFIGGAEEPWGKIAAGERPQHIDAGPGGEIVVLTTGPKIHRFDPNGAWLGSWQAQPADVERNRAIDVAAAKDGSVYILYSDAPTHFVHHHAADGTLLHRFPDQPDRAPDYRPYSIDVGPDGRVVVTEVYGILRTFSPSGDALARWPAALVAADVAYDHDGTIYVATSGSTVEQFTQDGTPLALFRLERRCDRSTRLDRSVGYNRRIAVDDQGRLWVAQQGTGCVEAFSRQEQRDHRWRMEVFGNRHFAETPLDTRFTDTVRLGGSWGLADPVLEGVDYAARLTRTFYFDKPRKLHLDVLATGGLRAWIDESLVIDDRLAQSVSTSVDQTLEEGEHRIVIEYTSLRHPPRLHVDTHLADPTHPSGDWIFLPSLSIER